MRPCLLDCGRDPSKENNMAIKKETKKEEIPELQISFEKALEKLEGIVDEMESGKLSLEAMISRFEESQKLIKFCGAKLNAPQPDLLNPRRSRPFGSCRAG